MFTRKGIFGLLVFLLLLPTVGLQAAPVQADGQTTIDLHFENGMEAKSNALVRQGISYVPAALLTGLGFDLSWDSAHKRAEFNGIEKNFAVRLGSTTGFLDNKVVPVGAAPFESNRQLYLPAQFVVTALGGKLLQYDASTRKLTATGNGYLRYRAEKFEGAVYTVSYATNNVYITANGRAPRIIGNLSSLGSMLDWLSFQIEKTPQGLIVLQISNTHGEPHVFSGHFTYLLKNGYVIRHTAMDSLSSYPLPTVWSSDGKLLFNNGQQLRLIEDGTGAVVETVDLVKLTGLKDPYTKMVNVEAWYPDIALVRPYGKGLLTIIDRVTGEQTQLYKLLLPNAEQELIGYPDFRDPWSPGDSIRFVSRSGNKLTFSFTDITKTNKVYTLPNKPGGSSH